jgi:hypothetical protein
VAGLLTLVNTVLKLIIGRPRPPAHLVQVLSSEKDNGFLSGYAFFAIVILGLLAFLLTSAINSLQYEAKVWYN